MNILFSYLIINFFTQASKLGSESLFVEKDNSKITCYNSWYKKNNTYAGFETWQVHTSNLRKKETMKKEKAYRRYLESALFLSGYLESVCFLLQLLDNAK